MDTELWVRIVVYDVTTFKIIERAMDLRGTKFLKTHFFIKKKKLCFSYEF